MASKGTTEERGKNSLFRATRKRCKAWSCDERGRLKMNCGDGAAAGVFAREVTAEDALD
jgi:hypothetical protein